VVQEQEREKEEREKRWRRQPRSYIALPPRAGPVGPADDNGGTRMLWLCPSPALQVGVAVLVMISPSVTGATDRRRPVLPCHAIWPTDLLVWGRTGIEPHSASPPGTVRDMGALV
jgi:hypothetical protein